ncbi:hypothetical protein HPB50_021036 [Hyalomma asiaticum]|uniref:Uncharacterized protein n=1 Tax=Hyalomma asiaticum TaxID=266040 RepID=A0ACB7SAX5_HYAAI|nr:hypothetical protein HPB50_021036 [Hyalomma asiaticum]
MKCGQLHSELKEWSSQKLRPPYSAHFECSRYKSPAMRWPEHTQDNERLFSLYRCARIAPTTSYVVKPEHASSTVRACGNCSEVVRHDSVKATRNDYQSHQLNFVDSLLRKDDRLREYAKSKIVSFAHSVSGYHYANCSQGILY